MNETLYRALVAMLDQFDKGYSDEELAYDLAMGFESVRPIIMARAAVKEYKQ